MAQDTKLESWTGRCSSWVGTRVKGHTRCPKHGSVKLQKVRSWGTETVNACNEHVSRWEEVGYERV